METLHLSGNSSTSTSTSTSTPDDFSSLFIEGVPNLSGLSASEKFAITERQYTGANSEDASSLREYLTDNLELY